MIADWQGRAPLSEYEGRWIYYAVEDKSTGRGITFEFWPVVWVNASCEPPCTIQMDFILRNVNWITK
jgi:thymidylate synthase